MFWCIRVTNIVSPEFCLSYIVIFWSFFADQDGWEAEKAWNSVKSAFLWQICWFFTKSQSFWGEMCPYQTLDMKWIQIALKYCTLTLISSLERYSMYNMKLSSAPPILKQGRGGQNTGGSYRPMVKATELHLGWSFQGYHTQPYLAHRNTCAKHAKYAKYAKHGQIRQILLRHPHFNYNVKLEVADKKYSHGKERS